MKKLLYLLILITVGVSLFLGFKYLKQYKNEADLKNSEKDLIVKEFSDNFRGEKILEEAGSINESADSNWWVNSGAYAYYKNGILSTIQGNLDSKSKWFTEYKESNPKDTDNGFHPQNIFRLVLKSKWKNFEQECFFRINNYYISSSENRNQSNGILLFNRYLDGDNLYYVGLRVDGYAVVKKKHKGSYYTLATKKIIDEKYDIQKKPNLLPIGKWIGVKSALSDTSDNKVKIELFLDLTGTGEWTKTLEAIDDGLSFGGSVINSEGHAGMRTDFMDVDFRDYKIKETILD